MFRDQYLRDTARIMDTAHIMQYEAELESCGII
jgi:hypothetical protein